MLICKFCGQERKNTNALRNHERLCKLNPMCDVRSLAIMAENRRKCSLNRVAWNKGLSKVSDERVAKYAATNSAKYTGKNSNWFGRKHSEETKKKISETQKKNYKGVSRYATIREHRQSYAESYFDCIFTDAEKQLHVNRFFLDYAWPLAKFYIEVDGEQHYSIEGIAHDKERTKILQTEGWTLLKRIRWAEWQKLSMKEKENEIFKLKHTIKSLIESMSGFKSQRFH